MVPFLTIYYVCPELDYPSGGVRIIYRHVDALNANGYHAAVLHHTPGYRSAWFQNETRIVGGPLALHSNDILVFPEILASEMNAAPPCPKVIFNQNAYYTFATKLPAGSSVASLYRRPDVIGAMVVSEDSRRYLEFAFEGLPIVRVQNAIDPTLFHHQTPKKRQICLMPRKHPGDVAQVLGMLESRGTLRGWSVVLIDRRTEAEVAAIMRGSAVFLSFGYPEGYPLPPAEAMACGCLVVGYHGFGSREYFTPETGFPVEVGDIMGFTHAVEHVLQAWDRGDANLAAISRCAAERINLTCSPGVEQASVLQAWSTLLRQPELMASHSL